MVIDQSTCIGCNFCTYACKAVNDTAPQIDWNYIFTGDFVIHSNENQEVFLPRPCMHCENAPCTKVCPVKATYTRSDGIVMMDYEKCIGCRYCMVACPYSARYFNWKEFTERNPYVPDWGHPEVPRRSVGVVEKCTFCIHRIDGGLKRGLMPGKDLTATPACVNICPTGARIFGDLNDPESKVSKLLDSRSWIHLLEELGAEPRVYYLVR
ncbi:MAG: 4Fe-4S dicluster domain-containing protein [Nitrososphaeria archaeon]|nr:4Fe-4S dicluster domain-containing protein [Nitrososphaeria archaeon]NIN53748.1 4Fe-4S dicluster domain-containing protein [Nitrososphaeria archaeon]NIQ34029.1 4Fe-4S dicluster domain-containing protein [Nitrososphaeria archaeon]